MEGTLGWGEWWRLGEVTGLLCVCEGLGYEAVWGWGSRLHCLRAGISLGLDDRITQEHAAGARNYLQCGHSIESVSELM